MKNYRTWCTGLCFVLLFCGVLFTMNANAAEKGFGKIIRLDDRLNDIIPQKNTVTKLASGFTWAEGPVWIAEGGYLLFSDIPRNSVMKWKEGEGISVFLNPSGYTGHDYYGLEPGSNGLALDKEGQLMSCEHGDRRVSVLTKGGGKRTFIDNYMGKRLNSPNDLVMKSNGDIYFTDPIYGLPDRANDARRELDFCGVYRLSTDGTLTLLTDEMTRPNGLAFSPDESKLYVAQSDPDAAIWREFVVHEDGTLGEDKLFYDITNEVGKKPGLPDGLKVDAKGNLFATGPGGVLIFSPDATLLGVIETGVPTANCGWGNDGHSLYITADSHLLRLETTTKGAGW
ncbi:Gluconolactonase precursor [Polystyrenella longa]|uniref:Gluconolactonase n=1 Tax=Polystyrenella longa TaxID=2528007 RepID=A0A518CMD8_9PLAN|nr:SMP-30/gluconolactonase/LRE family protein [Polystyrenella longa]QDU80387.1 Gluconolactonase precursor [Polystyrenella longa]